MGIILACGAILWDDFGDERFIGGAPFNVTANLSKLGADAKIISRIGRDKLGVDALNECRRLGVDTSLITVDPTYPTGVAIVRLDALGAAEYEIPVAAFDHIQIGRDIRPKLEELDVDLFVFGILEQYRSEITESAIYEIIEITRPKHVFLDVNLRLTYFSKEILDRSFKQATIIKLNDDEAKIMDVMFGVCAEDDELVLDKFAAFALTKYKNIEVVCMTLGKDGTVIYTRKGKTLVPGEAITVVDTVGCGDAFCAGFIYEYLYSKDPVAAGRAGNALGARVAQQRGAN